eukprot:snap_masked-scaffold_1-processed-gene-24.39-mRNA-1 protein AED:1.00 eAED:1.00 QI:0/0/0/0/1/1/2/0/94
MFDFKFNLIVPSREFQGYLNHRSLSIKLISINIDCLTTLREKYAEDLDRDANNNNWYKKLQETAAKENVTRKSGNWFVLKPPASSAGVATFLTE